VYGLEGTDLDDRKNWVLRIAGLEQKENTLTASLSVGFKQRLALDVQLFMNRKLFFSR
jgi:ABC-2 type transport system ATP-binding protein